MRVEAGADSAAEIRDALARIEQNLAIDVVLLSQKLDALLTRVLSPVVAVDDWIASLVDGFIIAVPREEADVAIYHALRGTLEPGFVRAFRRIVQSGMTVVDVGANVGVYTLHALAKVGSNGRVIAFEPVPRTFEALRRNVKLNGFNETHVFDLRSEAVAADTGVTTIHYERGNAGHSSLFAKQRVAAQALTVPKIRLDDALPNGRVDVVKIDAEGAEPFVLDGMIGLVERNPDLVIFLEFAPVHLRRAGQPPLAFAERLARQFALSLIDHETGGTRPVDLVSLAQATSSNIMLTRHPDAAID